METKFNLVIIRIAICLAAYAAIAFGSMTLLRLTGDLVVCLASLAAILIAAVLAIDYFGRSWATRNDGGVDRLEICGSLSRHRRAAATLAGNLGFDAWIAKCLVQAASKKQEQTVPSVTGKVYNHSKRMKETRAVLDGIAAELRRIIGKPAEAELLLVA